MLFSVPVHFTITATRIGGERRQSTQAWTNVDFEMTDMSDDDVPMVVKWRQNFKDVEFTRSGAVTAIGASPDGEPMHVRKFGEQFFRPVIIDTRNSIAATRHGDDASFLTGQRAAELLANYDDTTIFATSMPGVTHQKRLRANKGDGFADFASVDHHDLDRRIGNVRERLSKFMLVEGVLYERCQEPKIVVFTTEVEVLGWREQIATFAFVTTNPHAVSALDKKAAFFELEDYALATAKANRANKSRVRKDELESANHAMIPEIDHVDSIYAQDVAWMRRATRIAAEIVTWIGEQRAQELSDDLFDFYRNLHKCLHMSDGEERWELMSDAMAGIVGECQGPEWKSLEDAASAGLEILDSRPVDVHVADKRRVQP
jgi:hypothetical protein